MKNSTFRRVIALAVVSISGILFIQVFWMIKAFDLKNKQFTHNVNVALLSTASRLCEINQHDMLPDPVEQLSSNYFVVNLNNKISPQTLESILTREFRQREIAEDFEYGIFDCTNEEMVYGRYVDLKNDGQKGTSLRRFPELNRDAYYFGVYFPNQPSTLAGELWIWIFSTSVLVVVVVFFGYTLLAIFKQRKLAEVQKDFINNMTHEFKTPISTIAISSDVLMSAEVGADPERYSQYAMIIKKEADRLKHQVEKVLQSATLEKDQMKLDKSDIHLNQIIQDVLLSVKLQIEEKKGQIIYKPNEGDDSLFADQVHITNVVHSLIDNAIKYSSGSPSIVISTSQENRTYIIRFSDNGREIPKEHRMPIFDKFYRVPTGNVHDVKGFGLGLYYAKMVVSAHGGQISLETSETGNTFIVQLPLSHD